MRVALLLVALLFCSLSEAEVHDILRNIPQKDRDRIEQLFSYLVQRDSLGYVLFGETKTAAFCAIPIVCRYALVPSTITNTPLRYQKQLRQDWAVWSYYQHRFKHPNLIVCEEYSHFRESAFLHLFFIDRRKLQTLLEQYHQDFKEVLGENYSPSKLLSRLERKRKLRPLIKQDEKLLGLILGFGRESSAAYKEMSQRGESDPSFGFAGSRPKGCSITPVSFRGNPESHEVKSLIEAYTKEVKEVEAIFKSDSFLKTTLDRYCAH